MYIADGFADDCDELIHRCTQLSTLSYEKFCNVWKEMNFAAIFHGRNSSAELAELSEEVLHIAKRYMVTNNINFEETVAGLFLVYGLLNIQPFSNFASVKFIPDDMDALERIELEARRTRRQDVLYILGAVLIRGPCQFHVAERERGMEFPIRKYLEGLTTIDNQGIRPKGVFFRQNEELDIIKELGRLNKLYKESKEGLGVSDKSLKYVDENFANELDSSLKKIILGSITEDVDDENDGHASLAQDNAQSIKHRAMRSSVQPMKHLVGLQDRKSSLRKASTGLKGEKSPQKGQIKSSKRKRKRPYGSCRKRGSKKKVQKESDSEEEDDTEYVSLSDTDSEDHDSDHGNSDDKDDDIEEGPAIEADRNFEIHSLPMLDNSKDPEFEIEFIDFQSTNEGEKNNSVSNTSKDKADKEKDQNIGNTSDVEEATSSDNHKFKKPFLDSVILRRLEKRDLKKPRVLTKFQRMGMLTVANFKDKNK